MPNNILKVVASNKVVSEELVYQLESMLVDAKAGTIQTLIGVCHGCEGDSAAFYVDGNIPASNMQLLGEFEYIKQMLIEKIRFRIGEEGLDGKTL